MSFQIPCATKHLDVAISDTGLDPAYLAVAHWIETETLPGALHAPVEKLLPALRASAPANPPAAQDHKLSEGKAHICLQQREEAAEAAEAAAELARRCDPCAAGQAGPSLASRGCSLGVARAGRRSPPKTSRRRAAEPSAQGSGGRYGGGGGAERAAGGGG
jgi:hypothetical protein